MFQGAYYGASIYQREFHPKDDFVFVKPENGPASARLVETMREYFAKAEPPKNLSATGNKDEALRNLFALPTNGNTYIVWWVLDGAMSAADGDRLLSAVVREAIFARPEIVRYYIWNFWTYLFGPPMLPEVNCEKCTCPPCFADNSPRPARPTIGVEPFSKVATPRVIEEMNEEHERSKRMAPYEQTLYAFTRVMFAAKPYLMILLFASVLLARDKARMLMLYCVAAVVIIGGTTALAWPAQARYQLPALPYIFAGAAVGLFEIIRRVLIFIANRRDQLSGAR
jgi:hypothetical protein